jgi:hypothetical protein
MGTRRIVTPIFRASYVSILEPKEDQNGNWVYSIAMIFDPEKIKNDPAWEDMKQIVMEAKKEKWPNGEPKTGVMSPFRRGEWKSETYPQGFDLDKYPEYRDKIIVSASSYTKRLGNGQFDTSKRPGVVGSNPKAIFDPEKDPIYSGMYARAEISAYVPKNPKAGDRVTFGLHHVQKCYDGEPLGISQGSPENAFGEIIPPTAEGDHADLLQDDLLGV